jgi:hypothetical protein
VIDEDVIRVFDLSAIEYPRNDLQLPRTLGETRVAAQL